MNTAPYKVYDNILDIETFNNFTKHIQDRRVPWYFVGTAYDNEDTDGNFSFENLPDTDSELGRELIDIVVKCVDSAGVDISTILRTRLGLITKTKTTSINEAHLDTVRPHLVGLLYLNDSDGETILYNETLDCFGGYKPTIEFYNTFIEGNLTELTRVSPKANRLLIFDGNHFHSSSTPTNTNRRLTLNFNFN